MMSWSKLMVILRASLALNKGNILNGQQFWSVGHGEQK